MSFDDPLNSAIVLTLFLVVTLCSITDILKHRIPNNVLWPALLLALVIHSVLAGVPGFVDCVLGMVVGLAMLFPLYFAGGTSAGDVKLLGVVGALFGSSGAIIAGIATLIFGGVLGVLFIAWRVIEPILMMQIAQLVRSGGTSTPPLIRAVASDRSSSSQFPYAPAIACGTVYSLWHLGYFGQVAGF